MQTQGGAAGPTAQQEVEISLARSDDKMIPVTLSLTLDEKQVGILITKTMHCKYYLASYTMYNHYLV